MIVTSVVPEGGFLGRAGVGYSMRPPTGSARGPRVVFAPMPGEPADVRTLMRFLLEVSGRTPPR